MPREVLADEQMPPASRWRAAKRLREYDIADRVAGARVLETIGRDPGGRPALRWRAAEELTRFGAKGRERGVPLLRAEVLRFLRSTGHDKPLQRVRLHQAVGAFEPEEGARALLAMTNDGDPVVRLRAAEAMFALRRDYRERAAVIARDVMRTTSAPWHVRRRAACDLARWSDLHLEEARAALS